MWFSILEAFSVFSFLPNSHTSWLILSIFKELSSHVTDMKQELDQAKQELENEKKQNLASSEKLEKLKEVGSDTLSALTSCLRINVLNNI